MERKNLVMMKGNPLTLVGSPVNVGDKAPDSRLSNEELKEVKLSSFLKKGKLLLILSVPSLDTTVCEKETRRFNQEALQFKDQLALVTISRDLPFAQKRWCAQEGIKNLTVLSDYNYREFGESYGVTIKELGLLARAIFLVDGEGKVRYTDIVNEVTNEPDYGKVIAKIQEQLAIK